MSSIPDLYINAICTYLSEIPELHTQRINELGCLLPIVVNLAQISIGREVYRAEFLHRVAYRCLADV